MKRIILISFLYSACSILNAQQKNYALHVDPMIGTGGHGHTFPGATVPFGMVQASPDTRIDESWDGCSGYHYSDSVIYGFSQTHLSGTGCSDYGDIMLMPMMGAPALDHKIYSSRFSHKNEKASAGFYAVKLDDENIDVELTATTRVGFHKYTFNKAGSADIILDLNHRDKLIYGSVKIVSDTVLEVMRQSEAWAKDQIIFARIVFNRPMKMAASNTQGGKIRGNFSKANAHIYEGNVVKICIATPVKAGEILLAKIAISMVSTDGAAKNMLAELPGWNFEKIKKEAETLWNKELKKIEVTTKDKYKLKIFYTALYHTMIQPNMAMDVDGMYRGRDNQIHKAEGFKYYSVFSLWDTFRAAHPLYTIIDQKRTSDFINTFLAQYEQGGRLPVWELASNETDCMIGYHSVSVIADAMVKGIKGFDYEKAFEASKHSAMLDHLGLKAYKKKGFISMEDEQESVSKTLEYAYDDWCIARMASLLNKEGDYNYFMKRSQSWKNVFDPETGFMRPKKNGGWLSPFNPREVSNNYTEGNSWQYTFFVPQDIEGLIKMMGGADKFEKKLDELFSASSQTTGREQADITGLIGQYAQGNEPSHHMAYLYNYIDKPSKTQVRIHQILNDFYKPAPDGLIGNEDCGQMSAWYILSSIGIYQVTPGTDQFEIGAPLFDQVKINLENGNVFSVKANGLSDKNYFVQSLRLNGNPNPGKINYKVILNGAELEFKIGNALNDKWLYSEEPVVLSPPEFYQKIIPVPSINAISRVFDDSLLIEMKATDRVHKIYFSAMNSGQSVTMFSIYTKPFWIKESKNMFAFISDGTASSDTIQSIFYKRLNNWKIKINSTFNAQYTAGGPYGIIDGLYGTENWRKGDWQGYQGQDFECVIDMGKILQIDSVSSTYLQDTRAWILFPVKVEYSFSEDGINFKDPAVVENTSSSKDLNVRIKDFRIILPASFASRYVKVKATNFGKLPLGHQGAGGDAFIFVDEISIK